ncbi:MAG: EAL domain-containing protein [Hyphomicrobiales bacterium]|nr:EAL domain-containing protein [Hyphomicrobiales bacterium]
MSSYKKFDAPLDVGRATDRRPGDGPDWQDKAIRALRRLDDITRLASDWVWETDSELRLSFVSPRAQELLGYHPLELVGRSLLDVGRFVDEQGRDLEPTWRTAFRDMHFEAKDRDGNLKFMLISALPVFDPDSGDFTGIRGIAEDITVKRQNEEMLIRLSRAVEQSPVLVMITNTAGDVEYVNPKYEETTGYSRAEVVGRTSDLLTLGHTSPEEYKAMWKAISSGREWRGELYNKKKNGEYFWSAQSVSPVRSPEGEITHFVSVGEDVTARKFYEERILRQSQYDSLTNLPNRTLLFDRLARAQTRALRDGRSLALMFVDLDRFKMVNDSLGHDIGDKVLKEVAERLSHFVGATDTIARLGSDEFVIVLADLQDRYQVAPVVSGIIESLARPFHVTDTEVHLHCSIGVAVFPEDGEDHYTLLKNADTAMHRAKELGGHTYRFFTPELNERATEYLLLGGQLRHAIERGELEVFYQPVLDMRSGQIVSTETLLRWRHPEMGMVSPNKFIPLAEDTGLIESIGEWVMIAACKQNRQWRDEGLSPIRVAVNVSTRQIRRGRLIKTVSKALDKSGMSPASLTIEITESAFLEDAEEINSILLELSGMGVTIAVDDFGTGYSSLSYLKRLPLTTLKIDRSFVHDVTVNPDAAAITEAIVNMAHSLKLSVVAEGVETMEQLQFLRGGGCEMMQGYLFSPAVPAQDFGDMLREGRRLETAPDLFSWLSDPDLH